MNELIPFDFNGNSVRVILDANNELLFVAKDVAEALEYTWAGSATIKHLPDEWKGVNSVLTPSGVQEMNVLKEPGLYFFLVRSDKPKALPMQRWIAGEVIPSIRKTGSYSLAQQFQIPKTLPEALRFAADIQEKLDQANMRIEQDKPKVKFADVVSDSSNTRCIRVWVKAMKHENNLRVGERDVFRWLVENKYIFREGKGYLPYARYESNGMNYFTIIIEDINDKPRRMLKITGKGVVALTSKVVAFFNNDSSEMMPA